MTDATDQEIRILRAIFWSERDPDGRAFVPLADAYYRKGRLAEALSIIDDGLERHPEFVSAHVVSARIRMGLGDQARAANSIERVLDLDSGNRVALRMRGELAEAVGDLDGALAAFRTALERDPGSEELELRVDRLALRTGESAEPIPPTLPPDDPPVDVNLGADVEDGEEDEEELIIDEAGAPGEAIVPDEVIVAEEAIVVDEAVVDEPIVVDESTAIDDEILDLNDLDLEGLDLDAFTSEAGDGTAELPGDDAPSWTDGERDDDLMLGEGRRLDDPAFNAFTLDPMLPDDPEAPPSVDGGDEVAEVDGVAPPPSDDPAAMLDLIDPFGSGDVAATGTDDGDHEIVPVTRTLGELYARQGFTEKAVEIFEALLLRSSPDDAELRRRIEELRAAVETTKEAPMDQEEAPSADGERAAASSGSSDAGSIGRYMEDLLAWVPGAVPIERLAPGAKGSPPFAAPPSVETPDSAMPAAPADASASASASASAPPPPQSRPAQRAGSAFEGLEDFHEWLRSLNR